MLFTIGWELYMCGPAWMSPPPYEGNCRNTRRVWRRPGVSPLWVISSLPNGIHCTLLLWNLRIWHYIFVAYGSAVLACRSIGIFHLLFVFPYYISPIMSRCLSHHWSSCYFLPNAILSIFVYISGDSAIILLQYDDILSYIIIILMVLVTRTCLHIILRICTDYVVMPLICV